MTLTAEFSGAIGIDDDPAIDDPTTEFPSLPDNDARLTPEQMAEKTDQFPYGRRSDGTPRAKPGPRGNGAPRPVAAPRPRKTAAKPAKKAEPDYRPGILGILQIPTMGLTMLGRQTKNPALQADGYTLAVHAPVLAEALNETAKQQPAVARALESIMKAGPYGAILGAVIPLVMQLAANHKVIPANPAMGIHDPATLVAASDAQLAAMANASQ
jgi:hypothetical protein